MLERDPGHVFIVEVYPAQESTGIITQVDSTDYINFRKRIGDLYPGNTGLASCGTSTQELLRVIIARSKYVNNQESHQANDELISRCRESIFDLEERAAYRRGEDYFYKWEQEINNYLKDIETAPTCKICGHIFCSKHES